MRFLIICYILGNFTLIRAQTVWKLELNTEQALPRKSRISQDYPDSITLIKQVKELRFELIKKGHLLASLDEVLGNEKKIKVRFYVGPKFKYARINCPDEVLSYLRRHGQLSAKSFRKVLFRPNELSALLRQVHETYENHGYPFCQVSFQQVTISGQEMEANLKVDPGKMLRFSKINLVGNPVLNTKLISSFLQIKTGDLFTQSTINQIPDRIKQLGFVEESKPAELLFTDEGVELYLYLKARPVSLINGVIGFQPDPTKGQLTLTGELRLKLVNVLKKAETFEAHWRSIQAQTQSLRANIIMPNLFQTPFGFDGQFQLYKRDSTFLETKAGISVQYALKKGNYLKLVYRRNASNVLSGGVNNPLFSNLGTVKSDYYGLAISRQQVDFLPAPTRGSIYSLELTTGRRSRKDSLNQPIIDLTWKSEVQLQFYWSLAKRHVLKLSSWGEWYQAPVYFENEAFRFGGMLSMRGFREETLGATSRATTSLEYRFMLERASYLFAFFDQSWYENRSAPVFVSDTPSGFGAGLTFGTNLGSFSISYAIGRQFSNPVSLRDGQVHFGYVSYF